MKRRIGLLSFLLILGFIYYSFYSLMPRSGSDASTPDNEFSTERALVPLKEISKEPHYFGSKAHDKVRDYIGQELEKLGLETQIHEDYVLNPNWAVLNKPSNILAKIEGSEEGKALLLLSHYDSAKVPSLGASDAGSGVVTILESLRAYLSEGNKPKNDIIILFTDAEENGLDGAKLFVRDHPWAKDVGITLNFEARGSGGPSNMIVETNGGNSNLIRGFKEANVEYPVATSLMYSIYKMLPNDTDSTIFREEGDIDGFFFAFIDDHFDYHTSNDNFERLDRNTLQHQGSYLLPLLHYYANADLNDIKSDTDDVYFNFPLFNLLSYPFTWILPMLILAVVAFILLLMMGFKNDRLSIKHIGRGFAILLLSLLTAAAIGYAWNLLLLIYPQYDEIQHGFTYNGHTYIAAFVVLTLAFLFMYYRRFAKEISPANLSIAPLTLWLIINIIIFIYLKGAAYFIVPVFFGLISLWVLIRQEKPNLLLLTLLAAPALFIFAPLIQFFPVGLGLEMLILSTIFTVLLFGLVISVLGFYKAKRVFSLLFFVLGIGFLLSAHFSSDFTEERQKPNSLIYYQNQDTEKAYWVTYDEITDEWTRGYLGDNPEEASKYLDSPSGSKYGTGYSFASEAPMRNIPKFDALLQMDSVTGNTRTVKLAISPNRDVIYFNVYADKSISFTSLSMNGVEIPKDSLGRVRSNRQSHYLMSYYPHKNDALTLQYTIEKDTPVSFKIQEYSYDLMSNPEFTINKRPAYTMPKPFINTDAVVVRKTIDISTLELQQAVIDSVTPILNE